MGSRSNDPTRIEAVTPPDQLTATARYVILVVAFLGWMFAGVQMSITSLAMRSAAIDVLDRAGDIDLQKFNSFNAVLQEQGKGKRPQDVLPAEDAKLLESWREKAA